ncbi:hypothetical protein L861_18230 [Litchfieldella anticariensis FP35 = DSM 16096]|uniref:Uncharacterized protein n=1 Tax=Litchfieldella anticariensis (strain DSM 16096 / CECT 5854 / CIP 108499 / LMG 22089 / FP35) TaxID=1121939 RepID=S2KMY5_LITA3|nr:hypothetical protein L861_18230 [Halomonas anticariensis FP35 = DSM 16096]
MLLKLHVSKNLPQQELYFPFKEIWTTTGGQHAEMIPLLVSMRQVLSSKGQQPRGIIFKFQFLLVRQSILVVFKMMSITRAL